MAELLETMLAVPDISCEHCVNAINGALNGLPGVEMVDTDIPTKTVHLRYDPGQLSLEEVEAVLDDIGYTIAKQ